MLIHGQVLLSLPGGAWVKEDWEHMSVSMKNGKNINRQKIISLSLVVGGTLGFFIAVKYPSSSAVHELFFGLSYLVIPLGLSWYAHTKGRSIGWGLLGLILFIGPLIALIALGLRPKPPVKPFRSWTRMIAPIIFIGIIGLLAAMAIPQKTRYLHRSYTSNAKDHVQSIHQALVKWQGDSELGDGAFPVMGDAMGEEEKAFSEAFPEEWNWLTNGDQHYDYSFKIEAGEDGRKTPKVTATAKNANEVYAETVFSLQDGKVEMIRIDPPFYKIFSK